MYIFVIKLLCVHEYFIDHGFTKLVLFNCLFTFSYCLLKTNTVNSEMFARTLFSLIFADSIPREFKVLANIDLL